MESYFALPFSFTRLTAFSEKTFNLFKMIQSIALLALASPAFAGVMQAGGEEAAQQSAGASAGWGENWGDHGDHQSWATPTQHWDRPTDGWDEHQSWTSPCTTSTNPPPPPPHTPPHPPKPTTKTITVVTTDCPVSSSAVSSGSKTWSVPVTGTSTYTLTKTTVCTQCDEKPVTFHNKTQPATRAPTPPVKKPSPAPQSQKPAPSKPAQPAKPASSKPAQPAQPSQPSKPSQPSQPSQPAQPSQAQPSTPAQPSSTPFTGGASNVQPAVGLLAGVVGLMAFL